MKEINLLPWRELDRSRQQKKFYYWLVGSLGLTFIMVFVLHEYLIVKIYHATLVLQTDQKQLHQIDGKTNLIKRCEQQQLQLSYALKVINSFKKNQATTIFILNKIIVSQKGKVIFDDFVKKGNSINLSGIAFSSSDVSRYVVDLNNFLLAHINKIQSDSKQINFEIEASQHANNLWKIFYEKDRNC